MLDQGVLDVLEGIEELPRVIGASAFHRAAVDALVSRGFRVSREVLVPNRGDLRPGRIDLVVDDALAVELDAKSPRAKSKFKIESWGGPGLVYCRTSREVWRKP